MHLPELIQQRLRAALENITETPDEFAGMIRPTGDPKFGDYQCNAAMPLAKRLDGRNPREVAADIIEKLTVDDFCDPPTIAGPGFINLKIKDDWITTRIVDMIGDPRCGVAKTMRPRRIVVDFSSPNVAKPMHVGHIRSTVIGDSLARTLRFLGHEVTTDNHLGDWGTQFGIIIYGYKHFGDPEVVAANPVPELAKLYRFVNQISEYQKATSRLPDAEASIGQLTAEKTSAETALAEDDAADAKETKKRKKEVAAIHRRLESARSTVSGLRAKVEAVRADPELLRISDQHADIAKSCLRETAKLHEGDAENRRLWQEFLPHCRHEIDRIYDRLDVTFDLTLGESFYHDALPGVVEGLMKSGLAVESEGAICVFLEGFDAPMIVRKKDGAFLYATTDLATLQYRRDHFDPDEILYVVDTRQGEHFDKLFALAAKTGLSDIRLVHVNFGTVLGADGRPLKTRSGTLIGLEGLLDDAVERATQVVCDPERLSRMEPPMDQDEQNHVAETVGMGAIKFADLSHQRTSDYRFNLEKMVALEGNTSTYVQYSYARTQSILRKAELDENAVVRRSEEHAIELSDPKERDLAIRLLQFEEALAAVDQDQAPNHLTEYLFETSRAYAVFNENCPVLKAPTPVSRTTRLVLVMLCGRVLKCGLDLLGIGVVPRM